MDDNFDGRGSDWIDNTNWTSSPPNDDPGDEVARVVRQFNDKYMVINEGGKAVVYAPDFDPILRRQSFTRITFEDLKRFYLNRQVTVGTDPKGNPIRKNTAVLWLTHPDRREFIGGVTFDPSGNKVAADKLNLWQGFGVTPEAGDWSLLKEHIWSVICRKDPALACYLKGWMARMVQFPAEQGEVAVVMKGGEGTGKGTLAKVLMQLMGQHGMAIRNAKHLTGNFNRHLRDTVFLFADEALYAGDPSQKGVLKAIITEPTLTIEAKNVDVIETPNFLHLMMASNEDWVIPAALDARRFFVLEVSPERANDHAYFAAIWKQMETGGYEAMLHDLLAFDLSTFNVRAVPVTTGLQQQKKMSLPTAEAWWMDVLHRGYVFRSRHGLEEVFGVWHNEVTTDILFDSYVEFAIKADERHPLAREMFGQFMVRVGAKPVRPRNALVGEHITDVENQYGISTRKAAVIKKARAWGYHLGTLETSRSDFCKATKLTVEWDGSP